MSPRSDAKSTRYRRQPVARHGALTSPKPFTQVLTILGAMLAVIVVSATALGGFYVYNAAQALNDSSVSLGDGPLPPHIGEIEGGVNLLVAGTDSCEGQDIKLFPRCAEDEGGERNDVTMLVHISDEPRRVTVVSFPRDMIVPIPACESPDGVSYPAMSAQMINTSFSYGGLPCTVATVEELTGIDIQFATSIRWTGVINMSDALGGVDVCVGAAIKDRHTGLDLAAGQHNLVGAEALQFLRVRHGIGDGSDLGRISNQQQFMGSLVRKLQSGAILRDYPALLNLANTAVRQVSEKQITLSESLINPQRMVQIAMAVSDVPYEDIVFVQYPTVYAPGGGRVLPVTSAADVLFTALEENKPIRVTGSASAGNGVEVIGEAEGPTSTPTPTPTDGTAEPSQTPESPAAEQTPAPTETGEAVELPSEITGQSANQVTCTVAQQ